MKNNRQLDIWKHNAAVFSVRLSPFGLVPVPITADTRPDFPSRTVSETTRIPREIIHHSKRDALARPSPKFPAALLSCVFRPIHCQSPDINRKVKLKSSRGNGSPVRSISLELHVFICETSSLSQISNSTHRCHFFKKKGFKN